MLLPVDQVRTSLQPYPNLPGQEKVVKTTTCISDAILKISSIVCLPFNLIGKVFGTISFRMDSSGLNL
jgi:hypothetical protein